MHLTDCAHRQVIRVDDVQPRGAPGAEVAGARVEVDGVHAGLEQVAVAFGDDTAVRRLGDPVYPDDLVRGQDDRGRPGDVQYHGQRAQHVRPRVLLHGHSVPVGCPHADPERCNPAAAPLERPAGASGAGAC
jgi:hypothetical protein